MGTGAAAIVDDPVVSIDDPVVSVDPPQKSLYQKLTETDQTTQNPILRGLSNAGAAFIKTPEMIGRAAMHPIKTATGMVDQVDQAVSDWSDPKTRPSFSGAMSVAPEAIGQGIGTVAGGEAAGALAAPAAEAAGVAARGTGRLASAVKGGIGTLGRNEMNELRPSVRAGAQVAGGVTGGLTGAHLPGEGALGALGGMAAGAKYAPKLLDKIIPNRPGAASMAERAAQPLSENPNQFENARKVAAQNAPPAAPQVQPWQGPLPDPEAQPTGQVSSLNDNPNANINKQRLLDQVEARKPVAVVRSPNRQAALDKVAPPKGPDVQPWQGPLGDPDSELSGQTQPLSGNPNRLVNRMNQSRGQKSSVASSPNIRNADKTINSNPNDAGNPILNPGTASDPFNEAKRTGEDTGLRPPKTTSRSMVKTPEEWKQQDLKDRVNADKAKRRGMGYAAEGKGYDQ